VGFHLWRKFNSSTGTFQGFVESMDQMNQFMSFMRTSGTIQKRSDNPKKEFGT
jgi:hypothetical protein